MKRKRTPLIRLVDDDVTVLDALTTFLQVAGMSVARYQGAREFLERDDPEVPGALVLDVRMPGMSGIELQEEMKRRGNPLPVIFLSAHGDIEMAADAVRRGAKSFLVKPPKPAKLLALVGEAVEESVSGAREREYGEELEAVWNTLTPAERQVALLAAKGLGNTVLARTLGVTERTVRAHKESVYRKLDAQNAVEISDFLRDKEKYSPGDGGGTP